MRLAIAVHDAGFCKQQLWPLLHYLLPLSPTNAGRFDPQLWQAYVKANKVCFKTTVRDQIQLMILTDFQNLCSD